MTDKIEGFVMQDEVKEIEGLLEEDEETRVFTLADKAPQIIVIFLMIVLCVLIIVLLSTYHKDKSSDAVIPEIVVEDIESDIKPRAILSINSTERLFGDISTHIFDVVNGESGEVMALKDVELPIDDIKYAYIDFLQRNKYKVVSIGLVNNRFYIQQDMSEPLGNSLFVSLISMNDDFTIEDWFKLTESIYNNAEVQADCIFSYPSNNGNKHYLYVYSEKESRNVNNTSRVLQ